MNAYNQMLKAKQAKKAAGKASRKAYNDAYGYSARHFISQYFGKNKKKSDKKWASSIDAMQKSNKADDAYKKAKKAYKDSYKRDKAKAKSEIKAAKRAMREANRAAGKAMRKSNREFWIWGTGKERQKELDDKMIEAYKAANKAEANYKRIKKKYKG